MQPARNWPPELLLKAQGIELVLLDVDGVLTDGGLVYGAEGEVLKRFHTLDGHGVKLLAEAGMTVAVISGRNSPAVRARLDELRLDRVRLGVADKLAAAEAVLRELGKGWEQVAAMGDDWPDLPLLKRARFSAAPPGAHPEVKARVACVTEAAAGMGAVRELCDLLLTASGRYRGLLDVALESAP